MTNSESSPGPFVDFIDDYFVECDEHLAVARQSLLALEAYVEQPLVDRSELDELFRSFHSIKGLSAMVGVSAAEQLAHQMESYLSALHKQLVRLTAAGLETLMVGVKTLEEILSARRAQVPPADITALLAQCKALLPNSATASVTAGLETPETAAPARDKNTQELTPEKVRLLSTALAQGAQAWRITFVPSPELAERGMNVNTVRQRLQEVGELIHGTPRILAGGQIAFTFIVASRAERSTFSAWQHDGLTSVAFEMPALPAAAPVPTPLAMPTVLAGSPGPSAHMPTNVVRVDLARLDELMHLVGELVISRARLDENLRRLEIHQHAPQWRALQETNQAIERQLRDLREGVMRVRLVPVREIFARMQFVVRDFTREHGKKIALTLVGQETEIDKFLVERMLDPLLHLVRNAVSHGLETPDERSAAGKPAEGMILLRAGTTGENIVIEVEDDGRGIDTKKVMERARAAGLIHATTDIDAPALLDILCAAGFSTRDEADRASGRGVGMAVVRTVIEELGGTLLLDTVPGRGTHFTIQLPLTLAIADALIVAVGGQRFAVPQVSVREVLQLESNQLKTLARNELIPYRAGVLPMVRLAAFFHLPDQAEGAFYALVVGSGTSALALMVERVFGLREIVVRPLTDPLLQVPGIAGATELGDGRVVLILDTMALSRMVRRQGSRRFVPEVRAPETCVPDTPSLQNRNP